ncbi:MAG: hypothetical protein DDT32_02113 [Syntrophomonadaceae bacterium]|nr:hypothetical protein [Bacillota bacterium]MBT9148341.1 hypothetical protein [Bacillota bacterium]
MQTANLATPVFAESAVAQVHAASQGIPRVVNLICTQALYDAAQRGHDVIEESHIIRILADQTTQTETGILPKENNEISASNLQNPSEPEATFRKKGKIQYTGYVVNTVEARDEEKELSMVIHHEQPAMSNWAEIL